MMTLIDFFAVTTWSTVKKDNRLAFVNAFSKYLKYCIEPANAAMHGPHSLVRFEPGCAGRA